MSGLQLESVSKRFGNFTAVADVNLEFPTGKFVCLLGPSGCGKTTLLRLIAGLEEPTTGRIVLDGKDLTHTPAHKREFGMVFQSLALFPHLTVGENIGYSLRIRGAGKAERRRRAEELLELVRLPGVADRHISQLSGGQRQRVAIARALALDPKLFLLDEPLSALDAKLREAMQVELRMLQQRLGITTIVVTHDQREAMTMADLVIVMESGYTRQIGSPLEIYRSPASTFVADFIGITNLISGKATGDDEVTVAEVPVRVSAGERLERGGEVTFSVRPEEVHVLGADQGGENRLPGEITFIRDLGASVEISVDCKGVTVLAITTPKERPRAGVGDRAMVELPRAACIALPS
ncbi:MAG: ABC transporter ATP-binding protein [Gammaproteobacteria bacterium]|nr:ABC transporter ATP-binding protein [Gammaproteobacteria bacterium]